MAGTSGNGVLGVPRGIPTSEFKVKNCGHISRKVRTQKIKVIKMAKLNVLLNDSRKIWLIFNTEKWLSIVKSSKGLDLFVPFLWPLALTFDPEYPARDP